MLPTLLPGCCGQVATCRTRGDLPGAVEYLRTYLDYWMNDRSAWEELTDLYLEVREGHTRNHGCSKCRGRHPRDAALHVCKPGRGWQTGHCIKKGSAE